MHKLKHQHHGIITFEMFMLQILAEDEATTVKQLMDVFDLTASDGGNAADSDLKVALEKMQDKKQSGGESAAPKSSTAVNFAIGPDPPSRKVSWAHLRSQLGSLAGETLGVLHGLGDTSASISREHFASIVDRALHKRLQQHAALHASHTESQTRSDVHGRSPSVLEEARLHVKSLEA